MAAQRNTVSGQGAKKRRKYIHFDALLFLVPFVKGRETCSNYEEQEQSHDAVNHNNEPVLTNVPTVEEVTAPVQPNKKKRSNMTSYEATLLDILKSKQHEEINEDKSFALMLVPMLGKLNDDQKHFAKIEILNVMNKARNYKPKPQPNQQTSQQHQLHSSQSNILYITTESQNLQSQHPASLQDFYKEFSADVVSPCSSSGTELIDLSFI